MSGLLGKLREGAGKAAFEADRLQRLNRAQSALRALERQADVQTAEMGRQTLALFDSGTLTQPELLALCQKIDSLRQQIAEQEARVEQIRQERPPEAPAMTLYGHICAQCQIALPTEADFCPQCGSRAVDVVALPPSVTKTCAQCGARLAAEALFCWQCGTPVRQDALTEDAEVEKELGGTTCPDCQTSIPDGAVFCPECGRALRSVMPVQPTEESPAETEAMLQLVVCPHCQARIPDEAVFCPECGKSTILKEAESARPVEEEALSAAGEIEASLEQEAAELVAVGKMPSHELMRDDVLAAAEASSLPELAEGKIPPAQEEALSAEEDVPPFPEPIEEPAQMMVEEPPLVEADQKEGHLRANEDLPLPLLAEPDLPLVAEPAVVPPEPTEEKDPPAALARVPWLTCPICGASIPAEAVYCPECGTPTGQVSSEPAEDRSGDAAGPRPISCPVCKTSVPIEAVFCPECGTWIGSASAAA